jgi:4'-phosphopantetheinyl transferase
MNIYISSIHPQMDLKDLGLVTDARRKRIETYMRAEDKARCLTAGLLLRRVCGVTDDSQLCYGGQGKPYLKDGGLFFSIAHSGDYAVLATAGREVGADIEKITQYSKAVASRCFTAEEQKWFNGDPERFYRIWTAKESVMKATGQGFSLSPSSFCTLPPSPLIISGRAWHFDRIVFDGYVICTAVEYTAKKQLHLRGG